MKHEQSMKTSLLNDQSSTGMKTRLNFNNSSTNKVGNMSDMALIMQPGSPKIAIKPVEPNPNGPLFTVKHRWGSVAPSHHHSGTFTDRRPTLNQVMSN